MIMMFAALAAAAAPAVDGVWVTADRSAVVRIAPCGPRLCGTIVRMLAQGPNVPRTDINNPDMRLRSRPLVGLTVLSGFTPVGGGWRDGRAYDAKTGKSYRASLARNGDGSLTVTGCWLFICQSQRWLRVR